MADNKNQTIIIKKINKGGHSYHGGAWKVAYADFVTAMMAFFLLLWLLNATEAENLAGLADYFAPTIGIQGEMGIGFRGGKGALSKGIGADRNTNKGIIFGGVPVGPIIKVTEKIEIVTDEADGEKINITIGGSDEKDSESTLKDAQAKKIIEEHIMEAAEEQGVKDMVNITHTPEGVEIQLSDGQKRSMFEGDTDILREEVEEALRKLSEIIKHLPNYISISGHVSSKFMPKGKTGDTSWSLSSKRAEAARVVLEKYGVEKEQIARVVGGGDNYPSDTNNPSSEENNRITITLLRDAIVAKHKKSAPASVFIDTNSDDVLELINEEDSIEDEEEIVIEEEVFEKNEDLESTIKENIEDNVTEEDENIEINNPFLGLENSVAPLDLNVQSKKKLEGENIIKFVIEEIEEEEYEEYMEENVEIDLENLFNNKNNPSLEPLNIK